MSKLRLLGLGRFAETLLTRAQQPGTTAGEWSAAQGLLDEVRFS